MRSATGKPHELLRPAVFAAWALVLAYLLASGGYTHYLRPEFGFLLALALSIATGLALAAMTAARGTSTAEITTLLRALALVVPLLYLALPMETTLGQSAFKSRFIGLGQMLTIPEEPSGLAVPFLASDAAAREAEGQPPDAAPAPECTILDMLSNPYRYQNKRVIFTGMVLRDEHLKTFFNGRDTAIYRFRITCCAADAMPLAIALDSADGSRTADLADEQWVRVEGIFQIDRNGGRPIPWVAGATLTPVDAPRPPYLF